MKVIDCEFENGNKASLRHVTTSCIVIKNNKILLGKRSKKLMLEGGKWCLLGGFVNRDETVAEAAQREIREESGWEVENIRLLRINGSPDRPNEDRQNIDFIYIADAVRKTGEKDWESEEVRWFPLDDLPSSQQIAFDHEESINLFRRWQNSRFDLPFVGKIEEE